MTIASSDLNAPEVCVNHPRRETALHCGKCGDPICTRCMVQTPVGVRCRSCARLRRLPQFDVGLWLMARAALAGLPVSVVGWFFASFLGYLQFVLAIVVGAAVGEVMSRLAKRRSSRGLEVAAVAVVIAGLLIVQAVRLPGALAAMTESPGFLIADFFPAAVAAFVAVVKLR